MADRRRSLPEQSPDGAAHTSPGHRPGFPIRRSPALPPREAPPKPSPNQQPATNNQQPAISNQQSPKLSPSNIQNPTFKIQHSKSNIQNPPHPPREAPAKLFGFKNHQPVVRPVVCSFPGLRSSSEAGSEGGSPKAKKVLPSCLPRRPRFGNAWDAAGLHGSAGFSRLGIARRCRLMPALQAAVPLELAFPK